MMKNLIKSKTYCSCCGRVIYTNGREEKNFKEVMNYFSLDIRKSRHKVHMCQHCFEALISNFNVPTEDYMIDDMPVYTEEEIELLNAAYERELVFK